MNISLKILDCAMISMKYCFNNRQRQRVPSTDSSASEEADPYGPSSNEFVFIEDNHGSNVR